MRVKFQSIEQIRAFLKLTRSMESDVFIKQGTLQLDGRSPLGMLTAPLNYPMTVYVMEKEGEYETKMFIKKCEEIGILDDKEKN